MSDYWFRRLDAHMERANELFERNERAFERVVEADDRNTAAFERNTAAFERNTAAFERNTAAFERWDKAFAAWEAREDDLREFIREQTGRMEASGREQMRVLREFGAEIVTELRAQRGALLAILDRLSPGDAGSH